MMVLRMFLFLVTLFCLVASFYRGQFDGVSVIGLAAFVGMLATFGVFSRAMWLDSERDEELSRIDAEIDAEPAKRGPFSGDGWHAIQESGRRLMDEFKSGDER